MRSTNLRLPPRRTKNRQVFVLPTLFHIFRRLARNEIQYAISFSFIICGLGCHFIEPSVRESPLAPRETLRIATSGDYAPFSQWPATESEPTGFSVAVAKAYAEARGMDVDWIRFRWPELSADLEKGTFDLALSGITVRPDRSAVGRFSLPLTTSGAVALVPEESSLKTQADLNQPRTRLAVNAGGHLERVARRLFPKAILDAIPNNRGVLERLLDDHADAALTDSLEAPHWRKEAKRPLRAIGPLTQDRKAAWFPAGNETEAERFNLWLLGAESTGLLSRLRAQYGLPPTQTAKPLAALLSSLDERLTLMNAVADTKQILGVPIENLEREFHVLDKAVTGVDIAAQEANVATPNTTEIRRLFQAQIEAAKSIQHRRLIGALLVGTKSRPSNRAHLEARVRAKVQAREQAETELNKIIRPSLIYLGRRISVLLIASLDSDEEPLSLTRVSDALNRHHLPKEIVLSIYEPIQRILDEGRRGRTD